MLIRRMVAGLGMLTIVSCSDSCWCGEGQAADGEDESGDKVPTGGVHVANSGPAHNALVPGSRPKRDPDFKPIDAGAAAGTLADREGGHFERLKSPHLERFQALQKKLQALPKSAGRLTDASKLEAVFPDSLGEFKARGEIREGPVKAGRAAVIGRSREYHKGSERIRVKVTDVGQAPALRADFIRRLTLHGDVSVGGMTPVVIGDHVVLESYFSYGRSSWIVGLLGGRYLVEIRGRDISDPGAARMAFQKLALSGLMD